MLYKLELYDPKTNSFKPSSKIMSDKSRLKNRGFRLDKTDFVFGYVHKGTPLAGSCLTTWSD